MKTFWLILAVNGLLFSSMQAQSAPPQGRTTVEGQILEYAEKNLPQSGVLMENQDGYIYLKVADGYIRSLFPLLEEKDYQEPPYFRRPNSPGAHISVIYVGERNRMNSEKIEEIGQKFSFTLSDLGYVPERSKEYIVIQVHSPELEKLRQKYGLSPLLQGHEFHITIAKKNIRKHYHY